MRETPTTAPHPARGHGPVERYSMRRTLAVTAVLAAAVVVGTLAVLYPGAAVGAAVVGAGLAVAARPVVRTARHRLQARRCEARSREVCVPTTDVCVEA